MCQAITALSTTRSKTQSALAAAALWDGAAIEPALPVADPATWKT